MAAAVVVLMVATAVSGWTLRRRGPSDSDAKPVVPTVVPPIAWYVLAAFSSPVTTPAMPMPVRAAAADVLSLRVPLDEKLTAGDVKQAFVRSGVLFEPRLAVTYLGRGMLHKF